jgi:hypothetical protein
MKLTNTKDIPLELAVWLATDDYDLNQKSSRTISATTLLDSPRKHILKGIVSRQLGAEIDISQLGASAIGRSIHNSIEKAWIENYEKAFIALGIDKKIIDRIVINPSSTLIAKREKENNFPIIPIYFEKRRYKEIGNWVVSGKFDICIDGKIKDIKSTKTFTYKQGSNDKNYVLQGSIYRWLNQDIVTDDIMSILYIFKDWVKYKVDEEGYPPKEMLEKHFPLLSIEETEAFIKGKLDVLDSLKEIPEQELPLCTDQDLWATGDTTYKYYKDPNKTTRATRSSTDYSIVRQRYIKDNQVGIIKEVFPQVKACHYCRGYDICSQKDNLILEGRLIPKDQ